MIYDRFGVIGAGAWGTALALLAARSAGNVTLWARNPERVAEVNATHANPSYLPGVSLPQNITATNDLAAVIGQACLIVVPAQHLRAVARLLAPHLVAGTPVVVAAKGMEKGTGKLVTEIVAEVLPDAEPAVLSGPSFAADVANGLPTAITIAGHAEVVARLQATLGSPTFRPYGSGDLTGVALGGAAKNVYAIACGIVDGLRLGESARAALLARSFAELMRFGEALGARRETLCGLSGLGDLVLTASSPSSRNYAFGRELGRGRSVGELNAAKRPLAEGVDTAPALVKRARDAKIELPIAEATAAILNGRLDPGAALARLMSRPLTTE